MTAKISTILKSLIAVAGRFGMSVLVLLGVPVSAAQAESAQSQPAQSESVTDRVRSLRDRLDREKSPAPSLGGDRDATGASNTALWNDWGDWDDWDNWQDGF